MLRYCKNCKKDFDFPPAMVSGKDILICQECGNVIPKNSYHPVDRAKMESAENSIGLFLQRFFYIAYIFYVTVAIVGIVSFLLRVDVLLHVATVILLAGFAIQILTHTLRFRAGIFFIPLGALIGYLVFKNEQGICLGINVVFLIRHLIRDLLFTLISKLVAYSKK